MKRKEFVKICGSGCLGLPMAVGIGMSYLLEGCAGTKYFDVPIEDSNLVVPLSTFEIEKDGEKKFRKYIVAQNEKLEYPVCIYRFSDSEYKALLMRCTHQGTELQVFGDRLQCPAHGSEFSNTGAVQNGPADTRLRTFPVGIQNEELRINLS